MQATWISARTHLAHMASAALNVALPPRCVACGDEMTASGSVCVACWSQLHFISAPFCRSCGRPFGSDLTDTIECDGCAERRPEFDSARSALVYNHFSRRMILTLKHRERLEGVGLFARWMLAAAPDLIERADIVIPTPIHWIKLIRRGFNQTAVIATNLARLSKKRVAVDALTKVRATRPQVGLSAEQRKQNMSASNFTVAPKKRNLVEDRSILLIDDVYTTGATTEACTNVLKRAGAARVDILTLARVVNDSVHAI